MEQLKQAGVPTSSVIATKEAMEEYYELPLMQISYLLSSPEG